MILWLAAAFVATPGCASPPASTSTPDSEREVVAPPVADVPARSPGAASEAPRNDQPGAAAPEHAPDTEPGPPVPLDPVAVQFVRAMRPAIDDGPLVIAVAMDNLSHARPSEFEAMRTKLARYLDRAAKSAGAPDVDFVSSAAVAADDARYDLRGSAYLLTVRGLDVWQLFPRLEQRDDQVQVWEAAAPVHVLRQTRPGGQFFVR